MQPTQQAPALSANPQAARLYIDLLKKVITCSLWKGGDGAIIPRRGLVRRLVVGTARSMGLRVIRPVRGDERQEGRDWPVLAHSMTGQKRIDALVELVETVLRDNVPGDFIETGVWRGGSVILMRGVLKAWGVADRVVWCADSFEGLPPPDPKIAADKGDVLHQYSELAVSIEEVKSNFDAYGLLDDQVRFLKGWFKDTLPTAPIEKLAIARLDGDMYESTMDALVSLYPKLSPGGFLIVDDYEVSQSCKQAVHEYREKHHINEPIVPIDTHSAYWRRA